MAYFRIEIYCNVNDHIAIYCQSEWIQERNHDKWEWVRATSDHVLLGLASCFQWRDGVTVHVYGSIEFQWLWKISLLQSWQISVLSVTALSNVSFFKLKYWYTFDLPFYFRLSRNRSHKLVDCWRCQNKKQHVRSWVLFTPLQYLHDNFGDRTHEQSCEGLMRKYVHYERSTYLVISLEKI